MKNYNANWVKRRAKAIKKEKQIPHHEALDQASLESGFENWKHFLNSEIPLVQTIHPGMLVRFKEGNLLAIAASQIDESVMCYTHWGKCHCLRREISVCRD